MMNQSSQTPMPRRSVVTSLPTAHGRPAAGGIEGHDLVRLCKSTPAADDDAHLLDALRRHYPGRDFLLARGAEEWYRIGGVVDAAGSRIARDIAEWADRAFIECGQNFQTLLRYCRENGLTATRHRGITLFVAVPLGEEAEHFLQIEIDRVQEVRDRLLVGKENVPQDMEELIDPIDPIDLAPEPLGPTAYTYRRKTEVAMFMEELGRHTPVKHPVQRFMDDWNRSSAARSRTFCHEWILRLHQHRGRFSEKKMDVAVMAVNQSSLPQMESAAGKRGSSLQNMLTRFDKQAGFPFAWFFYMVARLYVPVLVGEVVQNDLENEFAYLPHRDALLLREWIADPYFV